MCTVQCTMLLTELLILTLKHNTYTVLQSFQKADAKTFRLYFKKNSIHFARVKILYNCNLRRPSVVEIWNLLEPLWSGLQEPLRPEHVWLLPEVRISHDPV
jgi:hypothetical protein